MNRPLNHDLLYTFITVIDTGSFTAAAKRLNSTQSTVSQQILRLESAVGQRLLEREHHHVRPTEAGEQLQGYARKILCLNAEAVSALSGHALSETLRLGLPEDFASSVATPMLASFMRENPRVRLEVTSGLSRDLKRAYDLGEFDLVLVKQPPGVEGTTMHWPEPLCWIDSASYPVVDLDPLPLVAFPADGLYRRDMTDALDSQGRQWQIVYTSSSLASVQRAVAAGMGVSLLPRRTVISGHRILSDGSGLPVPAPMEVAIHYPRGASSLTLRVASMLAELVEHGR
ncbi:LysR family transcriptional regulator [Halomonas denitrificans]|uniref:LysR family transcriptional regulator n=1 Tax=Halomonas denitrificans TaxID=370769 RepID=UPI000D3CA69D|nr:LysR family transcriptional regulator [Halomonas denitrificans]